MKITHDGSVLYTVKDLAARLDMLHSTLFGRIERGVMPGPTIRYGKRMYYTGADIETIVGKESAKADLLLGILAGQHDDRFSA